jgi:uncharacterized protein YdaT
MPAARPELENASMREESVPRTVDRYPAAMKSLSPFVREKAILIANALLDAGYTEDRSIRIAIARAKAWAEQQRIDADHLDAQAFPN